MKKSTIVFLLILMLIFSISCSLFTGSKPAIPTPMALSGIGINTTAGASSGVTFTITSDDDTTFYAKGAFDSVNLFGTFDTSGSEVACENEEYTCIKFNGELYLGDDGSGFPSGTVASYDMTLIFDQDNNATGTYVVGKIPPNMDFEQFGQLELRSE